MRPAAHGGTRHFARARGPCSAQLQLGPQVGTRKLAWRPRRDQSQPCASAHLAAGPCAFRVIDLYLPLKQVAQNGSTMNRPKAVVDILSRAAQAGGERLRRRLGVRIWTGDREYIGNVAGSADRARPARRKLAAHRPSPACDAPISTAESAPPRADGGNCDPTRRHCHSGAVAGPAARDD